MATRSRTEEFLQLRGMRGRREVDTAELLNGDEEEMSRRVNVAPRWVPIMEDIRTIGRQILQETKELDEAHKRALKVQFGASRNEETEHREIDDMTHKIQRKFKLIESVLNKLDTVYKADLVDGGTSSEMSLLRNVKMCLVNEVSDVSKVFRDNQRKFMRDLKKQKDVRDRFNKLGNTQEVKDRMEREALMDQYLNKGFTQEQIETVMLNQRDVEDRAKEFQDIFASISAIHEMFRDLNTLVIEQGTVLDRIDYNMNITHERVKKANVELTKAKKHQEAGRFRLCVLFLIVLIAGFAVALLMKMSA